MKFIKQYWSIVTKDEGWTKANERPLLWRRNFFSFFLEAIFRKASRNWTVQNCSVTVKIEFTSVSSLH